MRVVGVSRRAVADMFYYPRILLRAEKNNDEKRDSLFCKVLANWKVISFVMRPK